jgi:hypothetical protein
MGTEAKFERLRCLVETSIKQFLNEERVISVMWYEVGQSLRLLLEAHGTDIAPSLRKVAGEVTMAER